MDDQLLLGASEAKLNRQMQLFNQLGVDRVRVSAFWRDHAPASTSRQFPSGFQPSNHEDPAYNWATLDRVVRSAAANGLKVMISISTPAPSWAGGRALDRPGLRKPSPAQFGRFAEAVATRYATYVDHYGISNEPNQPGWLMPQSDGGGLYAPHHYRAMVQASYQRIKDADADLGRADRRARVDRAGRLGRRQGDPPAGLPARHGLRGPPLPADPKRPLRELRAGARRRARPPPLRAVLRSRQALARRATTRRSATAGA